MVIVIGGTGYVGEKFLLELKNRGIEAHNISRKDTNYYDISTLNFLLKVHKPDFLINCAGYTGKPNVDACELHKEEANMGNVTLPRIIAKACALNGVPWGHVSSGCIYTGDNGGKGFSEEDESNFSFDCPPCSHYSGTKVLGEQAIKEVGGNYYIWRLRIPFNEYDSPRNYLTKLIRYDKLLDAQNSVSHLGDFVDYSLDLWTRGCDYGIYNVVNTNPVMTRRVAKEINTVLKLKKEFSFFKNEKEMYKFAAKTPRSNCLLQNKKLKDTGIKVRTSLAAIKDSLNKWEWEKNENSGIDESFWK